ncbi:27737_t:CDS:1, partial [Racocetra persica]
RMNIEALNKELQEKAEQGAVKPSDFKQKTGTIPTPPPTPPSPKEKTPKKDKENGNKKNATVSAVVSYRVENIEGAIKDFDKDLAIFKDRVLEEFKQTEKTSL